MIYHPNSVDLAGSLSARGCAFVAWFGYARRRRGRGLLDVASFLAMAWFTFAKRRHRRPELRQAKPS